MLVYENKDLQEKIEKNINALMLKSNSLENLYNFVNKHDEKITITLSETISFDSEKKLFYITLILTYIITLIVFSIKLFLMITL